MVCQHCGGSGEEPPVSETVLEERGQGTLFTPALIVLLSLLVGIGLVDTAIVLAIALSELRSWRRHRRDRDAHAIPIESRRRPYPRTSREWERWA
jgi:hypothetical protein